MISLTANILVPNITRIRLSRPRIDEDSSVLSVRAEVGGAGGKIYSVIELDIRNGSVEGVQATPSPSGWMDIVQRHTRTTSDVAAIATAYTDGVAAVRGGTVAAGLRALETLMQGWGALPAGSVS